MDKLTKDFFDVFICDDGNPHIELNGEYEIRFSLLDNTPKLLSWISHLSTKDWMDADKIRELICRVSWLLDLNLNSYPKDESYKTDPKWIKVKQKS
tara:strand:+ start:308 stop:595 length:288 start_codon:yes stop_codon:yes gene_type:complete